MPWQTKAERVSVLAALAIKKEMVMRRLVQIREDIGHPDKPGKPLTVEDAASRAGVKYRTWQRWEAGESVPYARNLAAVADAFGFDVADFYDDSGDRAPTPDPFPAPPAIQGELAEVLQVIRDQLEKQSRVLERIERTLEVERTAAETMKSAAEQAGKLVQQIDADVRSGRLPKFPPASKAAASKTAAKRSPAA